MPFIFTKANVPINKEQELALKSRLGKAIELVPGKSEEYLMVGFESNCHLYLRGDDSEPMAYIEASIFGNEAHQGYDKFTAEVTRIFGEVLKIAHNNVYINYRDISGWGVSGMYIDRDPSKRQLR